MGIVQCDVVEVFQHGQIQQFTMAGKPEECIEDCWQHMLRNQSAGQDIAVRLPCRRAILAETLQHFPRIAFRADDGFIPTICHFDAIVVGQRVGV